ncbi:MAG: hypothetical protein R3E79_25410 [Caldilineaceae bacterium]
MTTDFSQLTPQDICAFCQMEREAFLSQKETKSPACVELFQRAFHTNEANAVWECLKELFEPLLFGWIRKQTRFEVEDAVQETWLNFYKGTVHKFVIRDSNHLEPILAFLKRCVLTVLAQRGRNAPPIPPGSLDHIAELLPDPNDALEQASLRADLERHMTNLFEQDQFTEEERLLFRLKFELRLKPREIMADYPQFAGDYDKLEYDLQRVTRRAVKYPGFRDLASARRKADDSAFLKIVTDQDEPKEAISVDHPCHYEEVVLLDYILGLVSGEVAAAIEASPGCLHQVSQLRKSFGPFLIFAYRLHCPSPESLVAYQQRILPGSERLVLYRHLEQCPRCREDLTMLETVDSDATSINRNFLRPIIEAIYQSPLTFGLQGSWLHYRTPEVFINISSRQNRTKARSWTMRTQIRTHEGRILAQAVEFAILERIDHPTADVYQLDTPTDDGSFVFREVEAGNYSLTIVMLENEIVIRSISIGGDS